MQLILATSSVSDDGKSLSIVTDENMKLLFEIQYKVTKLWF